ncbi:MAG: TolC family protein [bacterium]|nr:TolC family protein [bacterium]
MLVTAAAADSPPGDEVEAVDLGLPEVIEMTLEHDPNIALVESQLAASRGSLLSAQGRFDPTLSSSLTRSDQETPVDDSSTTETTTLRSTVGLTQELRTGLSLEPEIALLRTADADPTVNQATVSFTLRQPLLRGRGREVVASGELSAARELEASRLDLRYTISQRLRSVITQYWSVAAAMRNLDILRVTEESSRRLLETTRKLIAADITPAAELVQLEADLASKEAARIGGERSLFEARQDLGREIGLEPLKIRSLPLPADPFPTIEPEEVPLPADAAYLTERALAERADLQAVSARLEAAGIRLRAAEDALRLQLDLVLTPSYSSLVEGAGTGDYFSPLYDNVPGLSTSLGFSLSWPTWNRKARGDLIQAQAAREQGALRVELAARSIGAEIPTALDAVRQDALQLVKAVQAVGLFEQTVENEEKKLRAGSSTLIDVITQRDRLTAARQRRVSAQLALALALIELRFQTGTLLAVEGEASAVRFDRLTTIPSPEVVR